MMKKLLFLFLLFFSCNSEKALDDLSVSHIAGQDLIVYEGRVPLDEKRNLYLAISMLPGDVLGEGDYTIEETIEEDNLHIPFSMFKGKYSTLFGENPEDLIIQFYNSAKAEGVKRVYVADKGKKKVIREEYFRKTDLIVKRKGDDSLIILDGNSEPLTIEPDFNLIKRTSKVFTVEGYFHHKGDTADFFEMNTGEKWAVSKLGAYHLASRQYHELATEKFEEIYLKATAYSVNQANREGRQIEALVFKKIIQMTSSPVIESQ